MRKLLTFLCAVALASTSLGDTEIDASLDELRMGEYWYGAKVDLKDLRGKVVLVEYWGS